MDSRSNTTLPRRKTDTSFPSIEFTKNKMLVPLIQFSSNTVMQHTNIPLSPLPFSLVFHSLSHLQVLLCCVFFFGLFSAGLFQSSGIFVTSGQDSLAFYLAERGYVLILTDASFVQHPT
jgi:hypothetical protein